MNLFAFIFIIFLTSQVESICKKTLEYEDVDNKTKIIVECTGEDAYQEMVQQFKYSHIDTLTLHNLNIIQSSNPTWNPTKRIILKEMRGDQDYDYQENDYKNGSQEWVTIENLVIKDSTILFSYGGDLHRFLNWVHLPHPKHLKSISIQESSLNCSVKDFYSKEMRQFLERYSNVKSIEFYKIDRNGQALTVSPYTSKNTRSFAMIGINSSWINQTTFDKADNLLTIRLSKNGLRKVHVEWLKRKAHLWLLDLSHNKIKRLPEKFFNDAKALRVVKLNDNRLIDFSWDLYWPILTRWRVVSLRELWMQNQNVNGSRIECDKFKWLDTELLPSEWPTFLCDTSCWNGSKFIRIVEMPKSSG